MARSAKPHLKHYALLAASLFGLAALLTLGLLSLRAGPAEAQNILAVPACQCSVPTSILNTSTTLVHCLCGSSSCVISQETGAGRGSNLMQCVK